LKSKKLIVERLESYKSKLIGGWVNQNSNYEDRFCEITDMDVDKSRYWDVRWNDFYIELKKGNSRWLDLIRYSEIRLGMNEDSRQKTMTLFLIPDKDREYIKEIVGVETDKILEIYNLTEEKATSIINISIDTPGSSNFQQSLPKVVLNEISDFIIYNRRGAEW